MVTAVEPVRFSSAEQAEALAELARVLKSDFFRGSQRACSFLEYSVRQVLQGCSPEDLKERNIGIEVFHRSPDYDTAQDNIVRVTAYDVRKRLGQYYSDAENRHGPVLNLPVGSYAVVFKWKLDLQPASVSTQLVSSSALDLAPVTSIRRPEQKRSLKLRKILLAATVAAVAICAVAVTWSRRDASTDALQEVWNPILASRTSVLICVAQPMAYLPPENEALYKGPGPRVGTFLPVPQSFVGVGDAYALADVAGLLTKYGKSWHLLAGAETPVEDLKVGPAILIGAYSNRWSTNLTSNLRFVFADGTVIRDRKRPGVEWGLANRSLNWQTKEDYAIVSRLLSPDTGEPTFVIAGLTNAGTQAAAEFLTDREQLALALQKAPKDWKGKNFQFVLHTDVVNYTPKRSTVVAAYYW